MFLWRLKSWKLEYELFDWEGDVLIKEENYSYRFRKDICFGYCVTAVSFISTLQIEKINLFLACLLKRMMIDFQIRPDFYLLKI